MAGFYPPVAAATAPSQRERALPLPESYPYRKAFPLGGKVSVAPTTDG